MTEAVITANRLQDGVVVWRSRDRQWVELLAEAATWEAAAVEAALADARSDIGRQRVVGVYTVLVTRREGELVPSNVRETIRARGPTVRPDLGIQAISGAR